MSRTHVEQLVRARGNRPFANMEDLVRRTRFSRTVLDRLAQCGAFGSLGFERREALWEALAQSGAPLPLFESASASGERVPLVRLSPAEEVLADYRSLGLSLRAHPLSFLRGQLLKRDVVSAAQLRQLENGKVVSVAGIVLLRQRPATAKGITFLTLEDETGTANLIVRPAVWQRSRCAALGAVVLLARGRLQRTAGVIHVVAQRLEDLSAWLGALRELEAQSRDFC